MCSSQLRLQFADTWCFLSVSSTASVITEVFGGEKMGKGGQNINRGWPLINPRTLTLVSSEPLLQRPSSLTPQSQRSTPCYFQPLILMMYNGILTTRYKKASGISEHNGDAHITPVRGRVRLGQVWGRTDGNLQGNGIKINTDIAIFLWYLMRRTSAAGPLTWKCTRRLDVNINNASRE